MVRRGAAAGKSGGHGAASHQVGIDDGVEPEERRDDLADQELPTHQYRGAKHDENHALDHLPIVELSESAE